MFEIVKNTFKFVVFRESMVLFVTTKVQECTVKTYNMKNGVSVKCADVEGLEIEKIDKETFVLNTKKGSMKKVR